MYDDEDQRGEIQSDFEPVDVPAWPQPVDGSELLDRLVETFKTHLSLDPGVAEILALWTVCTHAVDACQFAPRLFLRSPVPRCGKTTALAILSRVTATANGQQHNAIHPIPGRRLDRADTTDR